MNLFRGERFPDAHSSRLNRWSFVLQWFDRSPAFSHAFSLRKVSEEPRWNSEDFKGECRLPGKTGCWGQQEVWKGQESFSSCEKNAFLNWIKIHSWFLWAFKIAEEASKNLASLKEVLCGTGDKEPQTEAVAQLAQELYNTNLLIALIANLQKIDFEVRFLLRLQECLT